MKKLIIMAALFSLTACSSDGDEIVFNTALGPQTETQVKSLPSDLRGDSDSARHSAQTNAGTGMQSEDGTND
ncbi:MAG: hypothetical protein JKY34_15760 [Kordiimonadaceae bacterium]|nr:hypothetical protein [Kordiimonadaceae bacterium]